MNGEYRIEVSLRAHTWDNKENPYFWCVVQLVKDVWCNAGFGWSKSPEQAWIDALSYCMEYGLGELT